MDIEEDLAEFAEKDLKEILDSDYYVEALRAAGELDLTSFLESSFQGGTPGVVLNDRLITEASLGLISQLGSINTFSSLLSGASKTPSAAPIKTEHSYSLTSQPTYTSIDDDMSDLENECYPAVSITEAEGSRVPSKRPPPSPIECDGGKSPLPEKAFPSNLLLGSPLQRHESTETLSCCGDCCCVSDEDVPLDSSLSPSPFPLLSASLPQGDGDTLVESGVLDTRDSSRLWVTNPEKDERGQAEPQNETPKTPTSKQSPPQTPQGKDEQEAAPPEGTATKTSSSPLTLITVTSSTPKTSRLVVNAASRPSRIQINHRDVSFSHTSKFEISRSSSSSSSSGTSSFRTAPSEDSTPPVNPQRETEECLMKLASPALRLNHSASGFTYPPTPPSCSGSDSESGGVSPSRYSPLYDRVKPPLCNGKKVGFIKTSNRNPIHTPLISSQPKGATGTLYLTEEEKRTLVTEGYSIPSKLPLTKAEEKSLKKIRRKIKNKISAQESRRKKKEYMDSLESKVDALAQENLSFRRKVETLQYKNSQLLQELNRLQAMVFKDERNCSRSTPKATIIS